VAGPWAGRTWADDMCACLRNAHPITGISARLAPGPGGRTLGRADFASAGRCTQWHEVSAPPLPFDQQGLVALHFLSAKA